MNTPAHKSSECQAKAKKYLTANEINQHLATRIWNLRDAQGLSQEKLAELAGVSAATIKRYENASSEHPSLYIVYSIACALGVSLDELLSSSNNTSSKTVDELRTHAQTILELLAKM